MPTGLFLVLLSLICPAILLPGGIAGWVLYPNMSFAGSVVLKLIIFVCSALLICYGFVRRERRCFSFGELVAIEGLCLFWALALDYQRIFAIVETYSEPLGPQAVAAALGMGIALNLLMLHLAFGILGAHFSSALLRRWAPRTPVDEY